MSVTRTAAGRILPRPLASAAGPAAARRNQPALCHHFHSSACLEARARSRFRSLSAKKMGLIEPSQEPAFAEKNFPGYTEEELEQLRKKFSSKHMEALQAGEAAIDPMDLTKQGRIRVDPYRMKYMDDFTTIDPVLDTRPKTGRPPNPKSRFFTEDEFLEDLTKWAEEQVPGASPQKTLKDFAPKEIRDTPLEEWPADVRRDAENDLNNYDIMRAKEIEEAVEQVEPSTLKLLEYFIKRPGMTHMEHGDEGTSPAYTSALPKKIPGVAGLYLNMTDPEDEGLDDLGTYDEVKKKTGMKMVNIRRFTVKTLVSNFVSNQTRIGKILSTYVMAMAGNKDGWLGIGAAKSTETPTAILKAHLAAIQNMRPIRRYENRTIYGTVQGKVSGTVVKLEARPPGFGLRVPERIFEMCRAAGISDLAAKIPRSKNPMNTVKATFQALTGQPDPEQIAIGRGKKLVDVRKVYYGGRVY